MRKPADKVIAPVLLDNPVLSHVEIIPHFFVFASANHAKILVHFARTLYLESFSLYSLNDIPVADLNAFRRSESSE